MEQSVRPYLQVFKASAGSGKTFTLAVQYIKHLILDPTAYKRILAVTFTNKATGEMKERILSQLHGLSIGDTQSTSYMNALMRETGKSKEIIAANAHKALHNILHDYSRFRIETIDSFFQSVMRNLAHELKLGANMTIDLNNRQATEDAVDAMIEKLDKNSIAFLSLIEYVDERINDNKKWNTIISSLKNFGMNLFNEKFIEDGEALLDSLNNPQFLPDIQQQLYKKRSEIENIMAQFGKYYREVIENAGLKHADFIRGEKGISYFFTRLENKDIRFNSTETLEKCKKSEDAWCAKSSPLRNQIQQLAHDILIDLLIRADEEREKSIKWLNSIDLTLRYLNDLKLLKNIDEEVRNQNRIHNRFLLAETNSLLHKLIQKGDASFIYEKIGTTIDIVMIDEFQDTSRLQWDNFHILLQESLSHKEGSLIVGDIKQSIYRWRSGDWKILANIDNDSQLRTKTNTLDMNWRSEQRIVHFNNLFFDRAKAFLNAEYQGIFHKDCIELENAYADVSQKSARTLKQGYVKCTLTSGMRRDDYLQLTLEFLKEEIERLVNEGVKVNDIAILIRHRKYFTEIASYFDQHTPYKIVSDEAFYLHSSLAVCLIIDALKYIVNPNDSISAARLALSYQKDVLHRDVAINSILLSDVSHFLPKSFVEQLPVLQIMPLYELCESIYHLFELDKIEKEDAYICSFFDALTEYAENASSDISAFISIWEESLYRKSIPSGEVEGIRIMTIHASKGLEYHTVLIPFCDWSLETEVKSHLIWCTTENMGDEDGIFSKLRLVPINYGTTMAESIYKEDYYNEKLQLWIDNLNLLYVAFTRACRNLIIWGQIQRNSVATMMESVLGVNEGIHFNRMTLEHESENETEGITSEVYEYGQLLPSVTKKVSDSSNKLVITPKSVPLKLESLNPALSFKQSNRSAEFIADEEDDSTGDYIQQGRLLHHLFEAIRTPDDLEPALLRLKFEGLIESDRQLEKIRKLMERALSHPKAKQWFSNEWTLYNECTILFRQDESGIVQRRPDRVMQQGKHVVVVDFKFGKKKTIYQDQVKEYLELMSQMGYEQVEGFIWYVYNNEIEEVTR